MAPKNVIGRLRATTMNTPNPANLAAAAERRGNTGNRTVPPVPHWWSGRKRVH
jgi:hypothetical protein